MPHVLIDSIDQVSDEVGRLAAAMRCPQSIQRLPDAILPASAPACGCLLVTCDPRDFPARKPGHCLSSELS